MILGSALLVFNFLTPYQGSSASEGKPVGCDQLLRWEISGSLVLSSPHHERTLAAAGRRAKESGLFFKFLSDKTQNHVLFDIIVDFVTHKLKNQPLFSKLRKAKFSREQAWIFLLRNCTIPNHNPEMRLLFQIFRLIFFIIILVTKSHDKQTTYIHMYGIYSQLVFRPFTPKRFGKTRLIFINCLKACNCCTLMDIIACSELRNSIFFSQVGPVWV